MIIEFLNKNIFLFARQGLCYCRGNWNRYGTALCGTLKYLWCKGKGMIENVWCRRYCSGSHYEDSEKHGNCKCVRSIDKETVNVSMKGESYASLKKHPRRKRKSCIENMHMSRNIKEKH